MSSNEDIQGVGWHFIEASKENKEFINTDSEVLETKAVTRLVWQLNWMKRIHWNETDDGFPSLNQRTVVLLEVGSILSEDTEPSSRLFRIFWKKVWMAEADWACIRSAPF